MYSEKKTPKKHDFVILILNFTAFLLKL